MKTSTFVVFLALFGFAYLLPLMAWIGGAGWHSVATTMDDFGLWTIIVQTAKLSFAAASLAVVMAFPVAAWVAFGRKTSANTLFLFAVASLAVLLIPRAFTWLLLFFEIRGLAFTSTSVVLVMSTMLAPVGVLLISRQFGNVRRTHIEAARTLGASGARTIWELIVRPRIIQFIEVTIVMMLMAAGYFVIPEIVGGGRAMFVGNVIATEVARGNLQAANNVGQIMALLILFPLVLIILIRQAERA